MFWEICDMIYSLIKKFIKNTKDLKLGIEKGTDLGSIINKKQFITQLAEHILHLLDMKDFCLCKI